MIGDLVEILVRASGGFWRMKDRILALSPGPRRRAWVKTYYLFLRNYNSFIGHSAIFANRPCLPHNLYGIFIAGGVRVGRNCVIFHQVTIGSNPLPDSGNRGLPSVGDQCYIGAGAMIIGGIRIGNNCRIGANCTVTRDVPDNSVVVSAEPRIISKASMDNRYYRWSPRGPLYYDDGKWLLVTDPFLLERLKDCV